MFKKPPCGGTCGASVGLVLLGTGMFSGALRWEQAEPNIQRDAGQCQGSWAGRALGRCGAVQPSRPLQPSEEGGMTSAHQEGLDFLAGFSGASGILIPHPHLPVTSSGA